MTVTGNDVLAWNWSPPNLVDCSTCASPLATPGVQTSYIVTVKNNYGCMAADTVVVKLFCEEATALIPNAFSPNEDGLNDLFSVTLTGSFIKHLQIFSRWGQLVFERSNFNSADQSGAWDGTIKGVPAPAGAYVYLIETQCATGEILTRKGTVMLVR